MRKITTILLLFLFSIELLNAQTTTVTGTVFDSEGETVIGAVIKIKENPSIGTTTDFDGVFTLNISAENKKLVVSYIGMKELEVDIKPEMHIILTPESQQLSEIVVTGMLRVDKRLFTGATDKIDADKAKLDGVADVGRALEGRSAGVSVQNISGTFGTAPKIRVRGATSIYGNSKPLWVVDGVIIEDALDVSSDDLSSGNAETLISSAIAGLNAEDIESFQILKDGSATSIYGARAMGGVIVITTKKGKAGSSRISYTGEFTSRLKPSYRDFNISNSQQQMGIYQEMDKKGWLDMANLLTSANSGIYGKMYQLVNTPIYDGSGNVVGYELSHDRASMDNYLRTNGEFINTDWFDVLFNQNIVQNHSLSISSGTEKSKSYVSLSALNDPGWYKSSNAERYTANVNTSYDILPNLTLNLLSNASYRKQKAPGTLGQEINLVDGEVRRDFDINPYSFALNTSRVLNPNEYYTRNFAAFNVLDELDNNYIDLNVVDLKFQGELNWEVTKGLNLAYLGAIRYNTSAYEHHIKDHSNQAEAYRAGVGDGTIAYLNPLLHIDPEDPMMIPVSVLPTGGIYKRTASTMTGFDSRFSATYNKVFDDTHITNFFGGMEINDTKRQKDWFRGWGFEYDKGGNPYYNYLAFKQGQEDGTNYYDLANSYSRYVSFFAQAIYSYQGKYTVNTGGRYEGNNRLGKSNTARWMPTWSVSGAWSAHEEDWFRSAFGSTFSHGVLKLSYSLTGNPPITTNAYPIYTSSNLWRPTVDVKESGLTLSSPGNEKLTYEKKHEFNLGFDLGFLNNRISFGGDVYRRDNYDLIGLTYTQGLNGFIQQYANSASMKSSGVEFSLSTKNIITKDFSWSTDFIFSKFSTEVTDLSTRVRIMELVSGNGFALVGYPHRALFSIQFEGLNSDGMPTFINEKGDLTSTDINFQEYEKLGYLKYEGPTEPTINGSLGNTFTWKNFKLNGFITYSFGNKVRLDPVFSASYDDLSSMPKEFKNRWVMPGDEQYTNIPKIAAKRDHTYYGINIYKAYNAYNYSTERVADGGFIRLKEISLQYNFPKSFLGSKIGDLQIKFQATNLFLLYSDKKLNGRDPEFVNSGGVASPMPKQFTCTLRLGL